MTSEEIVRRLSDLKSDYERVVPLPWTNRFFDWCLRVFRPYRRFRR